MLPDVEELHAEREEKIRCDLNLFSKALSFLVSLPQPKRQKRTGINRDHYGAHERLVATYFSDNPKFSALRFEEMSIMEIFEPEFLRKPTICDVEKLYACHEEKHRLSGMLESLDCIDWAWFGCPVAHKAQYCRHDHGPDPFIVG
nr:hypothetical protein [Tanacetum cinerariifolium]